MDRDKIQKLVEKFIIDSQNGLEIENPKVDFKRSWYDLTDISSIYEFLKDTTAIANTVGLDGYIIIGFDEKTKQFHNAFFSNSNLRDASLVTDMIIKRCSNLFDLNIYDIEMQGSFLSVIHIPPTLEKPIFIINYQTKKEQTGIPHRIFVRKNTTIREASKYDVELMFYDRKNLQPEYDLNIEIGRINVSANISSGVAFSLGITFNYENLGRRSLNIYCLKLNIVVNEVTLIVTNNRGGEIWKKGEANTTGVLWFYIDNTQDGQELKKLILANKRVDISLMIELSNGKSLYSSFDFIPPFF